MDAITAPAGITDDEWAATPPAVRTLVQELLAQIKQLEERVRAVEERARHTSRTTSRPPSSDPPSMPPRPLRRSTGRPSGGQVGHEGHGRPLLPPEQVTRIVEVKPQACEQCGQALGGDDPHPARHQVAEVPPVTPEVTEYRQHCLTCAGCGTQTRAPWPAEMAPGGFGPRVQATVAYLTGRLGVSQRDVAELLETLYGLEISLGSITALEQTVSAAVADPVAAAQAYVQVQPVVNMDETGWHEATQRRWLWTAVTPLVTVFAVLTTRGRAGAQALVGPTYGGIVGSDRWSAYTWVAPARRQLCWAHLQRDFAAFVERGGPSAQIGQALLEVSDQMFTLWYRVREGTLSPAAFTQLMPPLQTRVQALLHVGTVVDHSTTRKTCANILKLETALWTFVTTPGVEPTNNAAERALRRAVVWRRRSFGTQSPEGSRFAAHLLTVVTTLRQQHRAVLDYLTAACAAALTGAPAPSLLPTAPSPTAARPGLDSQVPASAA